MHRMEIAYASAGGNHAGYSWYLVLTNFCLLYFGATQTTILNLSIKWVCTMYHDYNEFVQMQQKQITIESLIRQ